MCETSGRAFQADLPGLNEIFDDESTTAQAPDQFLPAMEKLDTVRLTMKTSGHDRWERAGTVVRFAQAITRRHRIGIGLQIRRLFVLAEVDPAEREDACHLLIDAGDVRHIAGAHRLEHDFKARGREHR